MGGAEESQVNVSLIFKNFFGIVTFDERAIETVDRIPNVKIDRFPS